MCLKSEEYPSTLKVFFVAMWHFCKTLNDLFHSLEKDHSFCYYWRITLFVYHVNCAIVKPSQLIREDKLLFLPVSHRDLNCQDLLTVSSILLAGFQHPSWVGKNPIRGKSLSRYALYIVYCRVKICFFTTCHSICHLSVMMRQHFWRLNYLWVK